MTVAVVFIFLIHQALTRILCPLITLYRSLWYHTVGMLGKADPCYPTSVRRMTPGKSASKWIFESYDSSSALNPLSYSARRSGFDSNYVGSVLWCYHSTISRCFFLLWFARPAIFPLIYLFVLSIQAFFKTFAIRRYCVYASVRL